MAIIKDVAAVKVVLTQKEGMQTISGCSKTATEEGLYSLATAVAELLDEEVREISKVETTILIEE